MGRTALHRLAVASLAAGLFVTGCTQESAPVASPSTSRPDTPGVNLRGVRTAADVDDRFAAYKGPYTLKVVDQAADGLPAGTLTTRRDRHGVVSSRAVMGNGTTEVFAEIYEGDRCWGRGAGEVRWSTRTLPDGGRWAVDLGDIGTPPRPDPEGASPGVAVKVRSYDNEVSVTERVTVPGDTGGVFENRTVYLLDDDGTVVSATKSLQGQDGLTTLAWAWSSPDVDLPASADPVAPDSDSCEVAGGARRQRAGPSSSAVEPTTRDAFAAADSVAVYALEYARRDERTKVVDNDVRAGTTGWDEDFEVGPLTDGHVEVVSRNDASDVACITFSPGGGYGVGRGAC